jgi:hypothetical protein
MSSEHEHDLQRDVKTLRHRLHALPPGPEADAAKAALQALVVTLDRCGYDMRHV